MVKKNVAKKPAYQPPKLKTKNKWLPKNEEENSDSDNHEIEERKSKVTGKKKKQDVGRMTQYDKFDNPGLEDNPKMDYNSTIVGKKVLAPAKKRGTAVNTNTVTTFSRMGEDQEQHENDFDEIYGGQEQDNRVACKNCDRKFNPDRLPVHQKS
jgi:hypothetical protein